MKKRKFTTLTFHIDGETIRRSVAYYSAADLAQKRQQIEREIQRKSRPLFSDLAERWKDEHDSIVEYYTKDSYIAPLKDLISDFGPYPVDTITPLEIQSFLDRMLHQGFARQTINLRKVCMSMIMDYAVLHGFITFNPAKVCKVPKAPKQIITPPSEDDLRRIYEAPDSFWKKYFLFLMYTGLRKEEALAIQKNDLDFENSTVKVNKVVIFENARPVVRQHPKTAAGNRLAPFPIILHPYFENAKNGLIFGRENQPLTKKQFDHGIRMFKRETGITCNSHQLRHYFASLCHNVIDAKDAQHLLGHAKVSTTLDIYTTLDTAAKKAAIQKLNDHIKNTRPV